MKGKLYELRIGKERKGEREWVGGEEGVIGVWKMIGKREKKRGRGTGKKRGN